MVFRQVLHSDLGCASYFVADGDEAVVVDPKWEVEDYLALALEHRVRIRHILETHNHADHVSGKGALAAATGATIHVSAAAGVEFPHEPLEDGDVIEVGRVRTTAIATPGHRPEHLAFAVSDRSRSDEPWLLLTGDTLLVGDVGRPDLAVQPEDGARALYRSLRRLAEYGDAVEVWPGHVGGSLCGSTAISHKPSSTVAAERRWSSLLQVEEEDEFVSRLLAKLPVRPSNCERIVELNRGPLVTSRWPVTRLSPQHVSRLLAEGAALLDGRPAEEFDRAHIPGAVSVSLERGAVGTRAVWAADPEEPVVVTAARESEARRMAHLLKAVGFTSVLGLLAGGVAAWSKAGLPVRSSRTVELIDLARGLRGGTLQLLDVRDPDEWQAGHIPGALHVPCRDLREKARNGLPNKLPLAVACATGARSALAASVLERSGRDDVARLARGGVQSLADFGFELVAA
jgi:glyoxylase-like metal-dependent hydrolase (beta-lactamase superfamily II)/rhodanese-related sulfurtransferase